MLYLSCIQIVDGLSRIQVAGSQPVQVTLSSTATLHLQGPKLLMGLGLLHGAGLVLSMAVTFRIARPTHDRLGRVVGFL